MWKYSSNNNLSTLNNYNISKKIKDVLINRGLETYKDFEEFINPISLPDPENHFPDLKKAVLRVIKCIFNVFLGLTFFIFFSYLSHTAWAAFTEIC